MEIKYVTLEDCSHSFLFCFNSYDSVLYIRFQVIKIMLDDDWDNYPICLDNDDEDNIFRRKFRKTSDIKKYQKEVKNAKDKRTSIKTKT